jgi:alkylation response protein AidB-like acyl-CoA dehydrogenase
MHFGLTEDQQQVRDAVRGFLGRLPTARQVLDGADAEDPATWARICAEQGWQALLVPEANGGLDFGIMDMAVILEELGRRLTPCPLLPTAFATLALAAAQPSEPRDAALEAIAEDTPAALALDTSMTFTDGRLTGSATAIGAAAAGILVIHAGGRFFLVTSDATAEAVEVLDVTRPAARITLAGVSAAELVGVDEEVLRARCAVLVAAEAVGSADATLEQAVKYAGERHQFGRPIGSFQAIQHKCADMMVLIESARSATWYAAWAADSGAEDAVLAARTAKALACDAFTRCAGENIQIHGGIGFTWEHDAHLYFKRSQAVRGLMGSPAAHRAAVADVLLGEVG